MAVAPLPLFFRQLYDDSFLSEANEMLDVQSLGGLGWKVVLPLEISIKISFRVWSTLIKQLEYMHKKQ